MEDLVKRKRLEAPPIQEQSFREVASRTAPLPYRKLSLLAPGRGPRLTDTCPCRGWVSGVKQTHRQLRKRSRASSKGATGAGTVLVATELFTYVQRVLAPDGSAENVTAEISPRSISPAVNASRTLRAPATRECRSCPSVCFQRSHEELWDAR